MILLIFRTSNFGSKLNKNPKLEPRLPQQCVFNLVFSDCWVQLGSNLVQSEAIHKVWDGELTLDHLKRGYDDRTDYTEASGIHFTFPFAPWFKYNKRFYREWEKCKDEV